MQYIYSLCNGSAPAAVEEYHRRFPTEFQIVEYFLMFSIHCVKVVHFPVLMFHLNNNINKMCFIHTCMAYTLWRQLVLIYPKVCANSSQRGQCHVSTEKCITRTTGGRSFGYKEYYKLPAWRSPSSLYPTCDATSLPNRWIGHGSTINWPLKSSDLTPVDFCL